MLLRGVVVADLCDSFFGFAVANFIGLAATTLDGYYVVVACRADRGAIASESLAYQLLGHSGAAMLLNEKRKIRREYVVGLFIASASFSFKLYLLVF